MKYFIKFAGLFVVLFLVFSVYTTLDNPPKVVYKDKVVVKTVYKVKDCNGSLLTISDKTLYRDLQKYKGVSKNNKQLILDSIFKYSKKYNINPLIIYSIIATESSFRFWIKHSLSTITINKKKKQVRAIGLSAVIWEWWGDKLKQNHIAEVKSDLYSIPVNIQACCFIYSQLLKEPKLNGSKSKYESAMLRYFGGGVKNQWYVNRINNVLSGLMKQELYKGE